MVNYIYKGYGVTDSNGVAHLDHDASGNPINHSYTGVGAGEIDVVASLDNPISSGSIVSEPSSVFDTIKYDNGTDPNHNIWSVPSDASISYGEEYATFSKSVTGNKYASFNLTGGAVCFEFEVYQVDGYRNQNFFIITDSNYASLYSCQLQNISHTTGEWVKCRLTLDGTSITFEDAEDSTKKHTATTDKTLGIAQFSLIGSAFTELRYRNFKCYYI